MEEAEETEEVEAEETEEVEAEAGAGEDAVSSVRHR